MKTCCTCRQEKELDQFHKCSAKKDGVQSKCKQCGSSGYKEWYKDNTEKAIAGSIRLRQTIAPGVYLVKNTITGNIYIGQSVEPYHRFVHHMSICNSKESLKTTSKPLQKDVVKYGRDAFTFKILEHCEKEILREREKYYINLLNPYYNVQYTY